MRRLLQPTLVLVLVVASLFHIDDAASQQPKKRLQTGVVTGTYKYVLNTVEVLELPDHQVRIRFSGFWPNDRKRAETRNVGTFDETVRLDGQTAIVKIQYGEDPCTITLEFLRNKVIVEQGGYLGGCGFGFNVEADGTYRKVSSKPPQLPPPQKK